MLISKKRPCSCNSFYLKNHFKNYLFIYIILGCSGPALLCVVSLVAESWGSFPVGVRRLLGAVASLLQSVGSRRTGSVAAAGGLE